MPRCWFSLLAAAMLACAIVIPSPVAAETQAREATVSAVNVKAFDEAWQDVRESFYDAKLKGLDWNATGQKYRARAGAPGADVARIINTMLAELDASHTGYYTPDEIAYYDLADIFAGSLRRDLEKRFAKGEVTYQGVGMVTRVIDGRHFISGIFDGFPAARAGLMVGDEIVTADGSSFAPVRSFADKAGRKVRLAIRREAQGPLTTVEVVPQALRPNETFLAAMQNGARLIEKDGRKLGYVHIWSYARRQYQELLEELIGGKFKDADALIWDLRDGWGGAQPDYLDIFNARGPTMTLTGRDGAETVNARWRKPVILIINSGTRSGKEILAYGFKKYGYGEIVGTRSAGAVLAGRAFMQANGDLLLIAVADVAVDNERLEGVGVSPDHDVPFDIRYAKGADPQLAAAIDILMRRLN
ncbi:S41 family peptidase [Taklimakanibacter deserti]|uniref:S41 family peptidase n=1 Tax=Taklimakanibacter deserti TaxID=2267839 RepID=UPI0013C4553A